MNWLKSLFSSTDASSDSVIVGGLFSIASMTGLVGYDVIWRGHTFDAPTYAVAAGGLIAAIAGSKRWRDGATNGPN